MNKLLILNCLLCMVLVVPAFAKGKSHKQFVCPKGEKTSKVKTKRPKAKVNKKQSQKASHLKNLCKQVKLIKSEDSLFCDDEDYFEKTPARARKRRRR